jgi:copper(I)-binding protein
MKTNLVTLLMVVAMIGGVAPVLAQTKDLSTSPTAAAIPPGTSGARIQFAETIFDFGKVSGGEVLKHEFVFTNTGTATLEITAVNPACGCTTAGTWEKQVEPGRTGRIPLQFNPAAFSGQVTKPATVTCNDPCQSNIVLNLKATVWKPIEVLPPTVVFQVSRETKTKETRIVRLVSNLEESLELSDLQCTNDSFQAELKTVQPGKEFTLHITALPPFTSNVMTAAVTLKTSSPKMPTIRVNPYIMVQPPVTVTPSMIVLPPGPLTNVVHAMVTVRNTGTNTLALSDAGVNAQGAEVQVQEIQPGRIFSVSVDFPLGFQVPPDQKVELALKSNHPMFSHIQVPVIHDHGRPPALVPGVPPSQSRVIPTQALPQGRTGS